MERKQQPTTEGEREVHTHRHTHTHTHTHGRDYPGRPVPEETFTHSHPSWSPDILYQLPPFTTIHGMLFVQFTSLTVLSDNLSPGPLWSSSWSWTLNFILHLRNDLYCVEWGVKLYSDQTKSMHFFTQSSSSFRSTCSYQRSLYWKYW